MLLTDWPCFCFRVLLAVGWFYFYLKAVGLVVGLIVSLTIGDIVLMAVKIAVGLLKLFLYNKLMNFLSC